MAFNPINPVSVGLATKKEHYDIVFENAAAVRGGLLNLVQSANEIPVAVSSSTITFDPGLRYEGGDTLRVGEIEVLQNAPATPVAGRIYKNSMIKAWCVVDPWATGGANPQITGSYNIDDAASSIPGGTNGDLRLVFQQPLADANYAVFADVQSSGGDTANDYTSVMGSRTTLGVTVRVIDFSGNFHNPAGSVHVLILGN